MPSQIAPYCHIVFVSSLCSPSLCIHFKDQMHPPTPVQCLTSAFNGSWGGGGGKRVNQTSASSVVRHYVAKLQLNERALRGILTPSSFKSFRRGLRQDLRAPGSELRLQIEHCLAQQRTEKAVVYRKNLVSMIQCSKIEGLH